MTRFKELCELCERLSSTTKRLEKMALIARFLGGLKEDEIGPAALYISGRVFPERDPRTLGLGYRTISSIKGAQKHLDSRPLSIIRVKEYLEDIASAKGESSRARRMRLLRGLYGEAEVIESKWLTRLLLGEMRHGVDEGVMLEALSRATGVDLELVRRALMLTGDLGETARIALTEGRVGLESMDVSLFVPLKPMLAEMAFTINEILDAHGGRSVLEYKFDGARVQIHMGAQYIRIFSRRLSDVTQSLPDIVDLVGNGIDAREAILEGEVYGFKKGRPMPFQELMRRFKRVHGVRDMVGEIPVELRLFDLLYLDGKSLLDHPWSYRMDRLERVCKDPGLIAKRRIIRAEGEGLEFLKEAIEAGHEGIMAKDPDSHYSPGTRGKRWFKLKPAKHLDVVIVAAEWGHGRRAGWLSNYHLAVRDEDAGAFAMVGKTFKGLTDEGFREMTVRLLDLKSSEEGSTVYVKPEVVVEVAFNEIQRSPRYPSGFALRFARIKRIREDKGALDVDTLGELKRLYREQ
jgi:DNA ligase-1